MVFVLTTEGYINAINPALRLHKFKAFSGCDKPNPHISIDLIEKNKMFEITFLNGNSITLPDSILIKDSDGDYREIDKLKLGAKLAFTRTPDNIVERLIKRPEYISILNDLAYLIINNGKLRKVDYDATYCDITLNWSKEKTEEFIFSLQSIGIYIKVKVSLSKNDSFILTADSSTLNFIEDNKSLINPSNIKMLEDMKAIGITNIDRDIS